jgi:ribose-phosphate pyrophosphokinase
VVKFSKEGRYLTSWGTKGAANEVEARGVIGDVDGRCCVVIDDMIDTAGTIVKAAETLFENGAAEVIVAATHAILSDPARDRLQGSRISEVIVTNTLPIPPEKQFEKLTTLSIAPILAKAITEVFTDGSVTSMFEEDTISPVSSSH